MHDPGWRPALPGAMPFVGPMTRTRGPAIVRLRSIWLAFCVAMLLVAWVVTFIVRDDGDGALALLLVVLAGLIALLGVLWQHRRRIAADEPAAAVKGYTERFFLQMAFAETPGLLGFVAALASHQHAAVYVGVAISLALFVIAAPTRRRLDREAPSVRAAMCSDDERIR